MNKKILGWGIAGVIALGAAGSVSPLIFAKKPTLECTINENGEKEFGKVIKIESLAQMKAYLNQSEITVLGFGPDGWNSPSKAIDYTRLAEKFKEAPFLYVEIEKHSQIHALYNHSRGGGEIYIYVNGKEVKDSEYFSRYDRPGWGLEFYVGNYLKNKRVDFDQHSFNAFRQKKIQEEK